MKANLRAGLDAIKREYEAMPLPVYINDWFVKPSDVYKAVRGAIVEVQFELRHFRIQKKKVDSYNAKVLQVFILKPGVPRPPSAFKRWNVEDGPMKKRSKVIHVDEAKAAEREVEETVVLTSGVPTLELQIVPAENIVNNGPEDAESSSQGGKGMFDNGVELD